MSNDNSYDMCIIISGTRNADLVDADYCDAVFEEVIGPNARDGLYKVLVVAGCARGVDAWARTLDKRYPNVTVEVKRAEWDKHKRPGKPNPAGHIRNQAMVDRAAEFKNSLLGAYGIAFPAGDRKTSPGTWGCMEKMVMAGIEIKSVGLPNGGGIRQ